MNDTSIGVIGGQVESNNNMNITTTCNTNPLDLTSDSSIESVDSSPTLTNFSNISRFNAVITSTPSPSSDKTTTLIICSLAICLVAGLWLLAGYFIQELVPVYNAPALLTYLSVASLQFYFILIPKKTKLPTRRGAEEGGISGVIGHESDLSLDTYTNREVKQDIFSYFYLLTRTFV